MVKQIITELEQELIRLETKRDVLKEGISKLENNLKTYETKLENSYKARELVQIVAEQTQKQLEYHISNIVSLALASIWDDPYEFQLRFVSRRNKTECDLIFVKNGNETDDILNAGGGGPADVASFALRVALWSIKKTRYIQILDESFKFLSVDLQNKCSEMLKMLSEKLGIQIIMVSHLPNIISNADKIISVENKNGISLVQS